MTDNNRQPFSPQTALELPYRANGADDLRSNEKRQIGRKPDSTSPYPRIDRRVTSHATKIIRTTNKIGTPVFKTWLEPRDGIPGIWQEFTDSTVIEVVVLNNNIVLPVGHEVAIDWQIKWHRVGARPVVDNVEVAVQEITAVSNQPEPTEKIDDAFNSHSPDELTEAGIERKSTHWITTQHKTWWPRVKDFAAWAGVLSNEQDAWIHKALKVNSVKDFTGNETVATETVFKGAIRQYYRSHVAEMLQTDFQEATGFSSLESATAQGSLTYQEIMRLVEVHAAKELAEQPPAEIAPPTSATPVTGIGTQETPQNTSAGKSDGKNSPQLAAPKSKSEPMPTDTRAEIRKKYNKPISGQDYLKAAGRVLLWKHDHPDWAVETQHVLLTPEIAVFKAEIKDATGRVIATGHGFCTPEGANKVSGRFVEKAETAAVSRALSYAGYGTDGILDDDDNYPADSPVKVAA